MLKRIVMLTGAFMAVSVFTVGAHAQTNDRKSYPGSYCVEVGDSSPEAYYDSFARLRNDANGPNTFVCGVMMDHGSAKDISVSVVDSNNGDSVECIGQTRNESGSLGAWTQTISSFNGTSTLQLGSLSYKPSKGYHFVRCSVPGKVGTSRSGINSFYIRERD